MSKAYPKKQSQHDRVPKDDPRLIATAKRIGEPVEGFLAWRIGSDGSVIVIDHSGQKHHFSVTELNEE